METEVTIIGWSEEVMNSLDLNSNDKVLFCQLQHECLSQQSEICLAPLWYLEKKTGLCGASIKRSIKRLETKSIIKHDKHGRDRYFQILV